MCSYYASYADGSYTSGQVALEQVGFSVNAKQIIMGCARNSTGIYKSYESGIFGLGRSNLSLVSQLAEQNGRIFSHCLTPRYGKPGKLRFSFAPTLTELVGVSSTVLINTPNSYTVGLAAISIYSDNRALVSQGNHRLVLDTGSTATWLPTAAFREITRNMLSSIPVSPMNDPPTPFQICFKKYSMDELPVLYFYIRGDVQLRFEKAQLYVRVRDAICFGFYNHSKDYSILGSRAMVNYKIEYDTEGSRVYFQPKDCEDDDD